MSDSITLKPGESTDYPGGYVARSYATPATATYYAETINAHGEYAELSPDFPTFDAACFWLAAKLGIRAIDGRAARLALAVRAELDRKS